MAGYHCRFAAAFDSVTLHSWFTLPLLLVLAFLPYADSITADWITGHAGLSRAGYSTYEAVALVPGDPRAAKPNISFDLCKPERIAATVVEAGRSALSVSRGVSAAGTGDGASDAATADSSSGSSTGGTSDASTADPHGRNNSARDYGQGDGHDGTGQGRRRGSDHHGN